MRLVDSAEELHTAASCGAHAGARWKRSLPVQRSAALAAREGASKRLLFARAGSPADGELISGDGASFNAAAAVPPVPASDDERWGAFTDRLVSFSTIPFLFLLLPQLLKNHANLAAGNTAALAVLSWLGYLTGLGGNTLLLSYFVGKFERNAVVVQALGIASSFAVLTQIRVAGFMPRAVYAGLAVVVGLQAILTGLKLSGRLEGSKTGQQLWATWQKVLGLAGLAGVPQVLWATFQPNSTSVLPCQLTLAAGCAAVALEAAGRMPERLRGLWAAASAWTATALFMLQPVSQLVRNFQDPASLQGLSLATILLAASGNALMVPRALWTGDWVWLTGSMWGSLFFGWAQLLSMWLGRSPATGERFLGSPLFAAATLLLWAWFAGTFYLSRRARRKRAVD